MSDWKNWRWEKSMVKHHSSLRRGKGGGKAVNYLVTTTHHVTWNPRVIPTLSLILTFSLITWNPLLSVLVGLVYSFMFNVEVHQHVTEVKQ